MKRNIVISWEMLATPLHLNSTRSQERERTPSFRQLSTTVKYSHIWSSRSACCLTQIIRLCDLHFKNESDSVIVTQLNAIAIAVLMCTTPGPYAIMPNSAKFSSISQSYLRRNDDIRIAKNAEVDGSRLQISNFISSVRGTVSRNNHE